MVVADTFSPTPTTYQGNVAGPNAINVAPSPPHLGILGGQYVFTDAKGNVYAGSEQIASQYAATGGPNAPSMLGFNKFTAQGGTPAQYEAARQAEADAQMRARNAAYDAAARGDFSQVNTLGLSASYAAQSRGIAKSNEMAAPTNQAQYSSYLSALGEITGKPQPLSSQFQSPDVLKAQETFYTQQTAAAPSRPSLVSAPATQEAKVGWLMAATGLPEATVRSDILPKAAGGAYSYQQNIPVGNTAWMTPIPQAGGATPAPPSDNRPIVQMGFNPFAAVFNAGKGAQNVLPTFTPVISVGTPPSELVSKPAKEGETYIVPTQIGPFNIPVPMKGEQYNAMVSQQFTQYETEKAKVQAENDFNKALYSNPKTGAWGAYVTAHPEASQYDVDRARIVDEYFPNQDVNLANVRIKTEPTFLGGAAGGLLGGALVLQRPKELSEAVAKGPQAATALQMQLGAPAAEPFSAKYVESTYAGGPTTYGEYVRVKEHADYLKLQEQQAKEGVGGVQGVLQNVGFYFVRNPDLPITPAFFAGAAHTLGGVSRGGYLLTQEPSNRVATEQLRQTGIDIGGTLNPVTSNLAMSVAITGVPSVIKGASGEVTNPILSDLKLPIIGQRLASNVVLSPTQQAAYGAASTNIIKYGFAGYAGATAGWKYDATTGTWTPDIERGLTGAALALAAPVAFERLSRGQDLGVGVKSKMLVAPTEELPMGKSVTYLSVLDKPVATVYGGKLRFGAGGIGEAMAAKGEAPTALTATEKGSVYQIGGGAGAVERELAVKFENPIEQAVKGRAGGPAEYRLIKTVQAEQLGSRPLEATITDAQYGIKELFQGERFSNSLSAGEKRVGVVKSEVLNPTVSVTETIGQKPQPSGIKQAMTEWTNEWKGRVKIGGGTAEASYPATFETLGMRPKGVAPSADIDAVINEVFLTGGKGAAIVAKESAMAKLQKYAPTETFQTEPESGLIQWKNPVTGKLENLFDIHGQGVTEAGSAQASAYVFGKPFTPRYIREPSGGAIATSGTLRTANLGAISMLTPSGLGTAAHRVKDLAKFPYIQGAGTKIGEKPASEIETIFKNADYSQQAGAIDYLIEKGYPLKSYMGEAPKAVASKAVSPPAKAIAAFVSPSYAPPSRSVSPPSPSFPSFVSPSPSPSRSISQFVSPSPSISKSISKSISASVSEFVSPSPSPSPSRPSPSPSISRSISQYVSPSPPSPSLPSRSISPPSPPSPSPPSSPSIHIPSPPPPPNIPTGFGFANFPAGGGGTPNLTKGAKGIYNPSLVAKLFNIRAAGKAPKELSKEFTIRPIYGGKSEKGAMNVKDIQHKFSAFKPVNLKGFGKKK